MKRLFNKVIYIILILFFTINTAQAEYDDLYRVKYKDYWLYLNENGESVIKIPVSKFDDVGNFIEGRGFVTKKIKDVEYDEIDGNFYYKLVYIAIIDSDNNIIKKFDKAVLILDDDGETNASYIPEFYKGFARITFVENKHINKIKYSKIKTKDVYVDKMGNFVPENQIPYEIKEMLNNWHMARDRYEYNNDLIPKEVGCTNTNDFNCFAYVDSNSKVIIPPVWIADFIGCGDWYARSPYFYNDRAVAYLPLGKSPLTNGYFLFINTNGKPINNVVYKYVEPFYKKLSIVIFPNDERAYINTSGKVIWSEKMQQKRDKVH